MTWAKIAPGSTVEFWLSGPLKQNCSRRIHKLIDQAHRCFQVVQAQDGLQTSFEPVDGRWQLLRSPKRSPSLGPDG